MFCAVFWNIGAKTTRDGIVRLIAALQREEDADVIGLAECSDGVIGSSLRALNPIGNTTWEPIQTNSRVKLLVRSDRMKVSEITGHEYFSLFEIRRPKSIELLLAVTHMISRVHHEFDHIDEELREFANTIRQIEDLRQHTNTILLGDLNANPFANGVVIAGGLHAVMPRVVAKNQQRRVAHRWYPYFFNPMWQFSGDGTEAPAGTCYYAPEAAHRAFHWNIVDQILLRPALLDHYTKDSVQIIHTLARKALTDSNWIPDRSIGSDHLPIRIRLKC
jgi:hypothetical protein